MTGTVIAANTYATSTTADFLYAEKTAGNFVKHPASKIIDGQGTTTGQIHYASAANTFSKLDIGTPGQALTVAGGIPSWATLTDAFVLIQRQTFSAVASVAFTTGITSSYDALVFVLTDVYNSSSANALHVDGSLNSGSTWTVTFPAWALMAADTAGLSPVGGAAAPAFLSYNGDASLVGSRNGVCYVHITATQTSFSASLTTFYNNQSVINRSGGISTTATATNGIRFVPSAGTITGTIAMYGIKNT